MGTLAAVSEHTAQTDFTESDFAGFDRIVVGSGFFGLTVAERAATRLGERVLVSRFATEDDEPYYPISTPDNRTKLERHRDFVKREAAERNGLSGGRPGTDKYLDVHMAISSALSVFDHKIAPHLTDGAPLDGSLDA